MQMSTKRSVVLHYTVTERGCRHWSNHVVGVASMPIWPAPSFFPQATVGNGSGLEQARNNSHRQFAFNSPTALFRSLNVPRPFQKASPNTLCCTGQYRCRCNASVQSLCFQEQGQYFKKHEPDLET